MRAAAVGKPVIVTETGIPDNDDSRRELWATSYLKAVGRLNCRWQFLVVAACWPVCHSRKQGVRVSAGADVIVRGRGHAIGLWAAASVPQTA